MTTPDTEWEKKFDEIWEARPAPEQRTHLKEAIKEFISSHTTYLKERVQSLTDYIEHDNQCIISQAHRGRPTNDGGYETQYGDKWYRSPDKPECDCGLDTLLGNLK